MRNKKKTQLMAFALVVLAAVVIYLYHNPKVLIFDEATSALDNETEKIVMDAANNFSKNITLIIIAHRINALKKCNNIFKIDKGQIVAEGTFDELVNSNNQS